VTAIARKVESKLAGAILVTPTLWLGHSPHHMNFPGTLSAEPRIYIDIVKSLVHSMVRHGAKKIFLLNGHGGNEAPAPVALRELKSELSTQKDLFVTFASYWWLGSKTLSDVRKSGVGGVGHACEMETSAMLVIAPEKVNMKLARKSGPGAALKYRVVDMQASNRVALVSEFDELSDSGVLGEPELASVEKGHLFLDGFAAAVVEFLEDFRTWTPELVKGTTTSGR
jgi:creatinine amidohydrolase